MKRVKQVKAGFSDVIKLCMRLRIWGVTEFVLLHDDIDFHLNNPGVLNINNEYYRASYCAVSLLW